MMSQSWVGRTIGNRYRLETLLGAGGMSAVYRAYDPNLRRVVAVKLIHPHLSENPNFVNRFKEEAAAVASLRHPNIVQVHDFNNEGETYYMVMEYLAGETLQAHLRRINAAGRHLPLAEALRISLQICDAAGYAHRHDLIHRDIKPANIMLDVQGQAILMDFGIVKIVGGQYHTATGATIGTAIYMSPEQIRGERVDERSDIYSMGVMLFEMLSGRPPYEADSALTLMMMHLNDPIPNPSDLRPNVPDQLAAVVVKALAKEREQRYQTAAEMSSDLQKAEYVLTSHPVDVPTIATSVTPPQIAARPRAQPEAEPAQTKVDEDLVPPATEPTGASLPAETAIPLVPTQPLEEPAPAIPSTEAELAEVESPPTASQAPIPEQATQLFESSGAELFPPPVATQAIGVETPIAGERPPAASSATPAARHLPRWLLPLIGLALVIAIAIAAVWLINQRRPPALQLMPIERPSISINLDSQSQLVSLGQWEVDAVCQQLAFSPDLDRLASACNREKVRFSPYRYYASIYQVRPGVLEAHLSDHTAWMKGLDFAPDGATLATSAEDKRLDLWQVRDGTLTRTIESDQGPVGGLDFASNNELLAGAVWNGAGLWQVSNGNLLRTYAADEHTLRSVAFSPDGEYLAGGSEAGPIFLWHVSDGALLHILPGHTEQVNQLAFSPDGTQLASASDDHTLNLWRVGDGTLLAELKGHTDGVTGVAFSADGSLLFSSSWDGSLRLWRAGDGAAVRAIQSDDSILALAVSADSAWLATASSNGRLQFWGVSEAISLRPVARQ
jgi:serine/threonine protein kinase/WD40 repeat protein